jgi:hypothetical protein
MSQTSQSPAANGARQDSTNPKDSANTAPALTAQQDITASNSLSLSIATESLPPDAARILELTVLCRSKGVTIRQLAKTFHPRPRPR